MPRTKKTPAPLGVYGQRGFGQSISDLKLNQSYPNLILGILVVIVVGLLVFNYFRAGQRGKEEIGPAQQTTPETIAQPDKTKQVIPLPGNYTVKEGDTLWDISERHYTSGYAWVEVAKQNNLSNPDLIQPNQILTLPKLDVASLPKTGLEATRNNDKITTDTYTVQKEDWLSTIALRAYGDMFAYTKITQANNIQNPDLIEPGTVLKIPR